MQNPYELLYAPLPDVDAYLERIGFTEEPSLDLETLDRLIRCHIENVPFENIDVYYSKQAPSLEIPALWDKIITRRRGGYCFELNGLFVKLLSALGFEAYCVGVRIQMGNPFLRPILHRGVIVCLEEEKYFVDVGFGGPGPQSAICLTRNEWQTSGHREYRAEWDEGMVYLHLRDQEEEMILFQFLDDPADEVDFLGPNMMCSMVPTAMFYREFVVSRKMPKGHRSMNLEAVTLVEDGVRQVIPLHSEEERKEAAKKYFGILF